MFRNQGNHNNLVHMQNYNDGVTFKIIKCIVLMTDIIILLIYLVLLIYLFMFPHSFEQFLQNRGGNYMENRIEYKIALFYLLAIQSFLIYSIWREVPTRIIYITIFKLTSSITYAWSARSPTSIRQAIASIMHSALMVYYVYRIRKKQMRNSLYIANNGQQNLIYGNQAAIYSGYGQPMDMTNRYANTYPGAAMPMSSMGGVAMPPQYSQYGDGNINRQMGPMFPDPYINPLSGPNQYSNYRYNGIPFMNNQYQNQNSALQVMPTQQPAPIGRYNQFNQLSQANQYSQSNVAIPTGITTGAPTSATTLYTSDPRSSYMNRARLGPQQHQNINPRGYNLNTSNVRPRNLMNTQLKTTGNVNEYGLARTSLELNNYAQPFSPMTSRAAGYYPKSNDLTAFRRPLE